MAIPRKLFLSHANSDRKFVKRLATFLTEHRIPYWYSKRHLLGAQQWHDEIGKALQECDWFLVLISPAAVRSRWVKRELMYVLNADRYEKRIIPLLFRPCDMEPLSWTLASLQRVDFSREFESGCRELIRIWGIR